MEHRFYIVAKTRRNREFLLESHMINVRGDLANVFRQFHAMRRWDRKNNFYTFVLPMNIDWYVSSILESMSVHTFTVDLPEPKKMKEVRLSMESNTYYSVSDKSTFLLMELNGVMYPFFKDIDQVTAFRLLPYLSEFKNDLQRVPSDYHFNQFLRTNFNNFTYDYSLSPDQIYKIFLFDFFEMYVSNYHCNIQNLINLRLSLTTVPPELDFKIIAQIVRKGFDNHTIKVYVESIQKRRLTL